MARSKPISAVRSPTDPLSWGVGWELRSENLVSRARGTYRPGDDLTPHGVRSRPERQQAIAEQGIDGLEVAMQMIMLERC